MGVCAGLFRRAAPRRFLPCLAGGFAGNVLA